MPGTGSRAEILRPRPGLVVAVLVALVALVAPLRIAAQETGSPATGAQEQEGEQKRRIETVVTVTATRLPFEQDEITGATRSVAAGDLRIRPGTGLDEALRWIPELSLFRRAPARSAHPTTHGVNLRGVAPSGTSRALVLVDGVPLADAFGGWVQWDRVPVEALERVEVALGGGAAPLGNQALAGTIQLVTRGAGSTPSWYGRTRAGSDATWEAGGAASWGGGSLALLAAAHADGTDGYIGIAPAARGPVDTALASRGAGGFLKAELPGGWRLTGDGFEARRHNGTPLQTNRVDGLGGALSLVRGAPGSAAGEAGSLFVRRSGLDSVFTAVNGDRTGETAVLDQHVTSTDLGASFRGWRRPGEALDLAFGADARHVRGVSRETVLLAGITRQPGGDQTVAGAWVSARARPADLPWILEASVRGDLWRQEPRLETGPGQGGEALSPRLGVLWHGGPWSLRASGYGSFRAPTLNELYRQFRVGNVVTEANAALRAERLWGGEAGAVWADHAGGAPLRIEVTGFWNRLGDAVTNATLAARDGIVLRRRANLAAARVRGLELDARWRAGRLGLAVGATLLEARILAGPPTDADGQVRGNRLPQVPGWRLTASASWSTPAGINAVIGVHASGRQFEDDLNRLALAPGATLDLAVDWPVGHGLSVGAYGQNLTDERLQVGRIPELVLGPPRSLGLSLAFSSGS